MEAIPKPAGPVRSARGRRNPGNSRQGRCHGETKLAQHESHSPTPGTKLAQHKSHGPTPGTKLAQHESHGPTPGTKLAQHKSHGPTPGTKLALLAQKGPIWRVLRAHGELSTVFATNKPCMANFLPFSPPTSRAWRTLYRIQAGCGASTHNSTPGHTDIRVSRGTNE